MKLDYFRERRPDAKAAPFVVDPNRSEIIHCF
jgi:hypothetical protein